MRVRRNKRCVTAPFKAGTFELLSRLSDFLRMFLVVGRRMMFSQRLGRESFGLCYECALPGMPKACVKKEQTVCHGFMQGRHL